MPQRPNEYALAVLMNCTSPSGRSSYAASSSPLFTGGVGDLGFRHASPTPVRIPDQLCGRDFWPVFAGMAVTDHGEGTLNVSPGRVAAPLIALVRRELLRCNYRRSDTIRPSCQQRLGKELDAEVDARLHSRCGRRMSRRNEAEDSATWQIRARP